MAFEIPCECGRILVVGTGQAGSHLRCTCGKMVDVPSLRNLKAQAVFRPDPVDAHTRSTTDQILLCLIVSVVFLSLFLFGILSVLGTGKFAFFGYSLMLVSHFWLFLVMAKESGGKAVLMAIFVPIFSWVFAIIRWDASKWPAMLYVVGWVIFVVGMA